MARRKKKLRSDEYPSLDGSPVPEPDARTGEAAERTLCGSCGTSVPVRDLRSYLDPVLGTPRERCEDCARKALAEAEAAKPAPAAEPEPAPAPAEGDEVDEDAGYVAPALPEDVNANTPVHTLVSKIKDLIDQKARLRHRHTNLVRLICSPERWQKANPRARGRAAHPTGHDAQMVFKYLVKELEERRAAVVTNTGNSEQTVVQTHDERKSDAMLAEALAQAADLRLRLESEREGRGAAHVALRRAIDRVRELEHFLGLESEFQTAPIPGVVAPWMHDLAETAVAAVETTELDEERLVSLVAETLANAFTARTLETQRVLDALGVQTPWGTSLFALEKAVREVFLVLSQFPDQPPTDKILAIEVAWTGINAAAAKAQAAVLAERGRLNAAAVAEQTERAQKVTAGRVFALKRAKGEDTVAIAREQKRVANLPEEKA